MMRAASIAGPGMFGVDAALSPCLRMGAFMRMGACMAEVIAGG